MGRMGKMGRVGMGMGMRRKSKWGAVGVGFEGLRSTWLASGMSARCRAAILTQVGSRI